MAFISLTNTDQDDHIACNIVARELEVFMYQLNIENYILALKSLPQGDWPTALLQYRASKPEDLIDLSDADFATVADYQHRDHFRLLLRTENQQLAKSQSILDALLTRIPADQVDALVAQAKTQMGG